MEHPTYVQVYIELPRIFRACGYADDLSYNAQVYVQCPSCAFEERAFPPHLIMVSRERLLGTSCPSCNRKGRTLVRHLEHVDARCVDCGHQARLEVLPWVPLRCPQCQSQRLEEENSAIEPPMPAVFGELGERMTVFLGEHKRKAHPWGSVGPEDVMRISQEIMTDEPDAHLHFLAATMFIVSLITSGAYQEAGDYVWLFNAEGNFSRQFFRMTGTIGMALNALHCYENALSLAPTDHDRALCEHNVAMGINSMLAQYSRAEVEAASGRTQIREAALAACERAIAGYAAAAKKQAQGSLVAGNDLPAIALTSAQQVARVHHLMGDLLERPPTDDDQRRRAIEHYTIALATPAPESLLTNIRRSRGGVLLALDHPTDAESALAESDLRSVLE
jgi:predicted Zn-ribbon and HTH transcriptional regulator